ncbi:MAG: 50S ribosomal protein L5 [Proteobacteria bacterium]|nr:50S ribosomal protein L5 [Pseudomonadota bacterium]MBQ9244507.1 50S ribosomal protein L5 [Pseudomonadota bacterium]MBR4984921.1 50S ribosomal protein L5 [Pseudomonadota bacterium]
MTRLYDRYINEAVPALKKEFGYSNPMEIPRLEKVVLNVGLGDAVSNAKLIEVVCNEIAAISGQKPVVTKAKKSIASFKLRQGMPIGVMVTLRRDRMFEFLDRLMNIALPRVRDFRGVSAKAFDGKGNYTLGVKEHIIFPEIQIDKIEKVYGLNICVVTSARTDDEARALLKYLGMPFKK